MKIKEYFRLADATPKLSRKYPKENLIIRHKARLFDGTSVSIQQGEPYFCDDWTYEISHPEQFDVAKDKMLVGYKMAGYNDVYGYVPESVVNAYLEQHGGIASGISCR